MEVIVAVERGEGEGMLLKLCRVVAETSTLAAMYATWKIHYHEVNFY